MLQEVMDVLIVFIMKKLFVRLLEIFLLLFASLYTLFQHHVTGGVIQWDGWVFYLISPYIGFSFLSICSFFAKTSHAYEKSLLITITGIMGLTVFGYAGALSSSTGALVFIILPSVIGIGGIVLLFACDMTLSLRRGSKGSPS